MHKASAYPPAPLQLRLDSAALVANFRWFSERAGVPAIPAIKADGYGLGASEALRQLQAAGARQFAVSSWGEALALNQPDVPILIFHGFTGKDSAAAASLPLARPVLVTPAQCAAWRQHFPERAADLMVDTGMNRLGLQPDELDSTHGIPLQILHSHLACADEPDHPMTRQQLQRFQALAQWRPDIDRALANSAGICWGREFSFDQVRPGLGLYGGVPHPAAKVQPVVTPAAHVIQVRRVRAGETVGYGADWTAAQDSRVAIVNLGYADGIARQLGSSLCAIWNGQRLPLAGRISMDMMAVDISGADIGEGDWLQLDFDLPALSQTSGLSQYELLTWLSARYDRCWE